MKNLFLLCYVGLFSAATMGQTTLVSPSADGGFESGNTFLLNNWIEVNGSANRLYIGAAPGVFGGINCAFSGTSSAQWTGDASADVNFFYRDIIFGSEGALDISFYYKINSPDPGNDWLKVFLVSTSTVPVAGTELSDGLIGYYDKSTAWKPAKISSVNGSLFGTSARLVFEWKTDGSAPDAAVAVDDISVIARPIPAPLTGTYTIDPSGSGSFNFTTFLEAVGALNLSGPGTGGVTFEVADGAVFNEPGLLITATGTESNPIVFRQSGSGTKPVLNITPDYTNRNAIFLKGSDWVSLKGLNIQSAGTEPSEYLLSGILLEPDDASNGCNHNSVINCVITMDRTYNSPSGIYLNSQSASPGASNSYNHFYNNTVQNAGYGYFIYRNNGYDDGNEIGIEPGGTSLVNDISFMGIMFSYQANFKVFNTTVSNVVNTDENYSSEVYGIFGYGTLSSGAVYSNEIKELSTASDNYGVKGICINAGEFDIHGNLVHSLSSLSDACGIDASDDGGSSTSQKDVHDNVVYDISSQTTVMSSVTGIYCSALYGHVYNNMVSGIRAPGTAGIVKGLWVTGGSGSISYVFNNSVCLNDTSAGASGQSAAFYFWADNNTLDLRNNIFVNKTDVTSGALAVAFWKGGTSWLFSYSSDNNLYYAGIPGPANLVYFDGSMAIETLEAWKTVYAPRDNNAFSEDPPFMGITDLHLLTGLPTQCESGGMRITSPFPVSADTDGDLRAGEAGYSGTGNHPDLGADEGEFTKDDLTPPVISFIPLLNASSTAPRTLTAQITDSQSGIPTEDPGLPVIYWRKSTDFFFTAGITTWVSGNTYNFTFGGGSTGDEIQYYIVARDNFTAPNITSMPVWGASGFTYDPPACINPPTPYSYTIVGSICGIKHVGVGKDYATLTEAIADVNSREITCPVTLYLDDASYEYENWPVTINPNNGSSSTNTLTIKPSPGVISSISGEYLFGPLIVVFSSYTTIDGTNGSGTTTRDLTIYNTANAVNPVALLFASTGTRPLENCQLKNCNLRVGNNYTPAVAVSGSEYYYTNGYFHDITIRNNSIKKGSAGIYCTAVPVAGNGNGLLITGNNLDAVSPDNIRQYGIRLMGVDGATVSENIIGNFETYSSENKFGIYLDQGTVNSSVSGNTIYGISAQYYYASTGVAGICVNSGVGNSNIDVSQNTIYALTGVSSFTRGIFTGNTTGGLTIRKNRIYNIRNTYTGAGQASGIRLEPFLPQANISVINNMICDVAAYGSTLAFSQNGSGISVGANSGGYGILFNSVRLSTNQTVAGLPSCLYIDNGGTDNSFDVRNNIFQVDPATGTTRLALACESPGSIFSGIDNNDYYSTGPSIGYLEPFGYLSDLAAWRTASGQDLASVSVNPAFVSATELYPTNTVLNSAGVTVTSPPVSDDFYGSTRTSPPDIGAVEFGEDHPLLMTNPVSLAFGYVAGGGTSAYQGYTLSGYFLAYPGDITVTAPASFEISLTSGSGYASSLTIPVTSSTLGPVTIYAHFKPPVSWQAYSGNITHSGGGVASKNLPVTGTTAQTYCASYAASAADDEIFNVTVGTLRNNSACLPGGGPGSILYEYSNFTNAEPAVPIPDLPKSSTVWFSVQTGLCNIFNPYGPGYIGIWIDFNRNGSLYDAGEKVFASANGTLGPHYETGNFTIPSSGLTGWTLMRVALGTYQVPFACGAVSNTGETEDYLVNIVPASSCPAPCGLSASSITTGSATLSWTAGSATSWEYVYGPHPLALPTGSGTAVSSPSVPVSGLSPDATYGFYVRSSCTGGGFSEWSGPFVFRTTCTTTTDFSENFDAASVPSLPPCWSKSGTEGMVMTYKYGNPQASQPNVLAITSGTGSNSAIVVMPPLANLGAGTHQLRFRFASSIGSILQVGYMTDPANPSTFIHLQSFQMRSSWSMQNCFAVPGTAPGSSQSLAFRWQTAAYNMAFIDDVAWEPVPPCPDPTLATASAITTSSAVLGWTSTKSAFDIEFGPEGFQPSGIPTYSGVSNPFTVPGLDPNSNYTFYVRASCGTDGYSGWTDPCTFRTLCSSSATLDESFDGVNYPAFPPCWDQLGNEGDMQTTNYAPYSSPNCVYISSSGSNETFGAMLAAPGISNLGAGTHRLKFRLKGYNMAGEVIQVGYMINKADLLSFTLLQSFTAASTTTYQECKLTPGTAPGNSQTLVFRIPANSGTAAMIDNVTWTAIPSCSEPSSLTASGITGNSAILDWTSSESLFDLEVGLAGFSPTGTPTAPGVANPYTLNGLNPSTSYSFYVRSTCGSNGNSDWIGPCTFTTDCGTMSLPYTENFTGYTAGAKPPCWTILGGYGTTNWKVVNSANAGGTIPELYLIWAPQFNGSSYMTSPPINTSGMVSLNISFRHMINWYSGSGTFKVVTTSNGGATWNTVWTLTIGTSVPATTVNASITTADVGSEAFQYAFVYSGNSYNLNFWYLDNVSLTGVPPNKTLNLKVYLEGLYAGAGTMNQAQDEYGAHFAPGIADQVTVELHNNTVYSTKEYTSPLTNLDTAGMAAISAIPGTLSGSYYITVRHRNSIETTTAAPVSFAGTSISYDFTTDANKAFGDNQKSNGDGTAAIYGGDVNQDGIVDAGDMNPVDNLATAITFGYIPEDLNGDGIVDGGDMNIVDNNSTAIIMALVP